MLKYILIEKHMYSDVGSSGSSSVTDQH